MLSLTLFCVLSPLCLSLALLPASILSSCPTLIHLFHLSPPQHSPFLLSSFPFIRISSLPSSLNSLLLSIHLYFLLIDCVQHVKGRICQTAYLEADFPKEECWTVLMANLTIIHHQQCNLYHIVNLIM